LTKFTEEKLEQAVIELFEAEGYKHFTGDQIHKEMTDVLLRDDLKQYLLNRYSSEDITLNEIASIIRKLEQYPSSALYESNREIHKLIADGFILKREDRTRKDLFIELIDYSNLPPSIKPKAEELTTVVAEEPAEYETTHNIYKIVNHLEIQGYEKRIPDAIVYINGIPPGTQGGSDGLYDFTQLIDGKLVFTGIKATPIASGLWVFVTDSTGKHILWERQYKLPGKDAGGYELKTLLPLSVCATEDSGFTVVGDNNTYGNNHNAFAMHFVPSEPTTVIKKQPLNQSNTAVKLKITGSKVIFSFPSSVSMPVELSVYNAAGKRITEVKSRDLKAEKNSLLWDCSGVSEGIYLYRIRFTDRISTGKLVLKKV
jgi:hypothetical protein